MTGPNSFTERLFSDAGIAAGMNVVDIGCGNGEVTFLVARLVGKSGTVVGVDRDEHAIATAKKRAEELQCENVSFLQGDISGVIPASMQFDAAVGRRILMYLPDPVRTIQSIANVVRPGGILAFQESDATMVPSRLEAMPLHDQVVKWIWKTVEAEGANIHMGFNLPSVFAKAGIAASHIRAEPVIQGQGTHYPLAHIVRAMLPRMMKHRVVTESDIDMQTLEQRLADERAGDAVYISDMAFGIWGHKPPFHAVRE